MAEQVLLVHTELLAAGLGGGRPTRRRDRAAPRDQAALAVAVAVVRF